MTEPAPFSAQDLSNQLAMAERRIARLRGLVDTLAWWVLLAGLGIVIDASGEGLPVVQLVAGLAFIGAAVVAWVMRP